MSGLVPFNRKRANLINGEFNSFYNMLDDFFSDNWSPRRSLINDTFKLDVQENEKEYSIEAELPGVNKDEIDISLNDGRLQISVDRQESVDEEKKNYIHKERRFTSMSRTVYLADTDVEGIKAKLDNGVLNISIPKIQKCDTSKQITIE